jgi:hypothetical protein
MNEGRLGKSCGAWFLGAVSALDCESYNQNRKGRPGQLVGNTKASRAETLTPQMARNPLRTSNARKFPIWEMTPIDKGALASEDAARRPGLMGPLPRRSPS